MNQPPFFIMGAPHSGVSLLQDALSRHPSIAILPETNFFALFDGSRQRQAEHWMRIGERLGIRITPLTRRIAPGPAAGMLFLELVEACLGESGRNPAALWCDAGPENPRQATAILRTFPEARFILVYRDGRDVALEMMKNVRVRSDLYVGFHVWLKHYLLQRRLAQQLPQRILCVRYEDLVAYPDQELRLILDFLDLDDELHVVEECVRCLSPSEESSPASQERGQQPSGTGIGHWRDELTWNQITSLERWGGWALREMHYECVTDGRSRLPPWHFPMLLGHLASQRLQEMMEGCVPWIRDSPRHEALDFTDSASGDEDGPATSGTGESEHIRTSTP